MSSFWLSQVLKQGPSPNSANTRSATATPRLRSQFAARESGYLSDRSSSSDPLIRHQQLTDNAISAAEHNSRSSLSSSALPGSPTAGSGGRVASAGDLCAAVPGLVSQQLRVCEAHPNAMLAVGDGARRGIGECQNQFKHERWNCTPEGDQQVFGHTLQRGKIPPLR